MHFRHTVRPLLPLALTMSSKPLFSSTALALFALALLALAGCARKSDKTSLVVRVESDLVVGTDIDTVVVGGHSIALATAADLPVIVAFTPSGASNAALTVTAIARLKGADVVEQSVTTAFQAGAAVQIVMHLDRACISKTCAAAETCEAGNCGPKARTPTPYPGTSDAGNPHVDAAPTDAADAGGNDAHDAAMDVKPPAGDGSSDGGDAATPDASDTGASDAADSGSPEVQPVICGDGLVRGSEVCDDFNNNACGTCNASCTSVQMPKAALGSITAIAASMLINGETFTLSDGVHAPVVFEFNSAQPTDATHFQIFTGASPAATIATRIVNGINAEVSVLQIQAYVNAQNSSQVLLTAINPGAVGNVAITETVASSAFVVVGMSGGIARDCPLNTGCGSNDDCQSGLCCLGALNSATCMCPSGVCALNTCIAAGP